MPYPIRSAWSTRPGWSEFGAPRPGGATGKHNGFDYYCPEGTPIYATGNGVVKGRGTGVGPNSFGNNTTIWYDGTPIVAATYAHMNALPLHPVGTRVTANTIIGYVGHTGNAADVIWNGLRHVHEEILINGRYTDPITYHGGSASAGGTSTPIGEEDMPLTDAEITAIAQRSADFTWHYELAEPEGGVDPGRAHPAGDWMRYSDVRNKTLGDRLVTEIHNIHVDGATVGGGVSQEVVQSIVDAAKAQLLTAVQAAFTAVPGAVRTEIIRD